MVRFSLSLRLVVAVSLLGAGVAVAPGAYRIGDRPEIEMRTLRGLTVTSEVLKGRMVIVWFWAPWSRVARSQVPMLQRLVRDRAGDGVVILGIAEGSRDEVQAWVDREKVRWPQVLDDAEEDDRLIRNEWRVRSLPGAVVLGPDGQILWRGEPEKLPDKIDELLESHPTDAAREQRLAESLRAALGEMDRKGDYTAPLRRVADAPEDLLGAADVTKLLRELHRRYGADDAPEAAARALEKHPEAAKRLEAASRRRGEGGMLTDAALIRRLVGREAGSDEGGRSGEEVDSLAGMARHRFRVAERMRAASNHLPAYELYRWVAENAPASPQAQPAARRVKLYEADAAFRKKLEATAGERAAIALFSLAREHEQADRPGKARALYEQILEEHPDSALAPLVKRALRGMEKASEEDE